MSARLGARRGRRPGARLTGGALAALAVITLLPACKRESRFYEGRAQIVRLSVVRRDDARKPITMDAEISYDCPGHQTEVVRGGLEFVECIQKYKVGDTVPVNVEHYPASDAHYGFRVHAVGGCPRTPDPRDEASFAVVEECSDIVIFGNKVGFHCSNLPQKELVQKCPWFRR